MSSGIYYRVYNNFLDTGSPRNGLIVPRLVNGRPDYATAGPYYSGCNANLINMNVECRYVCSEQQHLYRLI